MTTMKPSLSQLIVALVGMAAVSLPLEAAQTPAIIFDNSATQVGTYVSPASLVGGSYTTEYGNQIIVGGIARQVTDFKFQYFLKNGSGDETARLRLYANDGPVIGASASPGTLLYDSTAIAIQSANSAVFDAQPPAGLVVPTTFTWTVSFGGVHTSASGGETNEVVGLLPYSPPTTGIVFNDMWVNIGGTWGNQTIPGSSSTFAAQVSAVPEPTVVQFGLVAGMAGLGMLGLRRRTAK